MARHFCLPFLLQYIRSSRALKAAIKFKVTILGTKPTPHRWWRPTCHAAHRRAAPRCSSQTSILAPGSLIMHGLMGGEHDSVATSLYNKFSIIFDTSMGCPHASGVAALLRAVHLEWSPPPTMVRSAMMMTANGAVDNKWTTPTRCSTSTGQMMAAWWWRGRSPGP
jgi:hypothetical protein